METTSAKTNHLRAPHGTFALAASARAHWVHWEDKLHVIIILVQSEFNKNLGQMGLEQAAHISY